MRTTMKKPLLILIGLSFLVSCETYETKAERLEKENVRLLILTEHASATLDRCVDDLDYAAEKIKKIRRTAKTLTYARLEDNRTRPNKDDCECIKECDL